MYRPTHTPIVDDYFSKPQARPLPASFVVMAWNVQKNDFSEHAGAHISDLLSVDQVDILALQEAVAQSQQSRFFQARYYMAPNLQKGGRHFGVVTASDYAMQPLTQCLTRSRELGWVTHKPALITRHLLLNGQWLTHLNIHAINFVANRVFKQELQRIWRHLSEVSGPMILSGDFNSWNKTRAQALKTATAQLGLTPVYFSQNAAIRRLNRQPLDHVFYRGLTVQQAEVLSMPHLSDHNPIWVRFALAESKH